MASGVYTLPAPTPGHWNRVQLPPDTVAFMFKNDSVFDFLLKFGGSSTPTFTASPGGQANAMVNALEYPVIYVQRRGASEYEQRLNSVGAWDGYLWYLAVDNTGGLATTGTISGRTVLNIMAYGPLDPVPPSGQAVTRQVDITSQPRVITIPMTPAYANSVQVGMTSGADAGVFPNVLAATNPAFDTGCVIYVYFLQLIAAADGAASVALRLFFQDINNPATTLLTFDALYGWFGKTGNVGESWTFNPHNPFEIQLVRGSNLPANTGLIECDIHCFASTVGGLATDATLMIDSDKQTPGQVGVPGIGGGLNPSVYGAGVPKF